MLDRSKLTSRHGTGLDAAKEIAKFDRLAKEWRDPEGKFKQVLAFNQTRLIAIEKMIAQHLVRNLNNPAPLAGLSLLDIGCGAGLLCEPLAELGADVTGIDASEHNILVASQHAKTNSISVNYLHCLASDLEDRAETNRYDIVPIPFHISIWSVQRLSFFSIQGALMRKWLFPFKSMQHRSGNTESLTQCGFQSPLCYVEYS